MTKVMAALAGVACLGLSGCGVGAGEPAQNVSEQQPLGGATSTGPSAVPGSFCQVLLAPGIGGSTASGQPAGGPIETGLCAEEADSTGNVCALVASPECVAGRKAHSSRLDACKQSVDDVACHANVPPPTSKCQVELTPQAGGPIETGKCAFSGGANLPLCALFDSSDCQQGRAASSSSLDGCGIPVDAVSCAATTQPPSGHCEALAVPAAAGGYYVQSGQCLNGNGASASGSPVACLGRSSPDCKAGLRVVAHEDLACQVEVSDNACR